MQRSTDRILTTHAGSLVRPPEIFEIMRAIEYGEPYDEGRLEEVLPGAVAEVVRRQAEAGVDVPSDGEFGKHGWIRYVRERLAGLEPTGDTQPAAQSWTRTGPFQERYAGFNAVYARVERTAWLPETVHHGDGAHRHEPSQSWACTGPIRYKGQQAIARDIANFRTALDGVEVAEAFMPVVAPCSAELHLREQRHYASEEDYLLAIADALHEEYRAIVDAGFLLQVDDAMLPIRRSSFDTLDEYLRWARVRIDALNHALRGIPAERVRYHMCWGSQNVPHTWDVPLRDVLEELILRVDAQAYALEAANPRHEHEWQVWRDVKLPDGKILVPGLISHSTNVVEHPELVAWRLANFASVVGRENLIAGTDCGFSQNWDLIRVHPEVQWAKLEALAEGARLASRELWAGAVA